MLSKILNKAVLGFSYQIKWTLPSEWSAVLVSDMIKFIMNLPMNLDSTVTGNADFDRTTGRIGVTYSPMKELNFFANWGQGFLPPATDELLNNPNSWVVSIKVLLSATSNSI